MGASVSNFAANVAKTVAKSATTALGNMIPVVGPTLAGAINSAYKQGGTVVALEAGGVVPEGFKAKVIDTPQQLMTLVKQFPTEAKKAGLSLGIIKDAVNSIPAEMMKRGGRKKKVVRQKQKQSQNVNVKIRVGDTVMLRPDSQKPKLQPRLSYAEPLRMAGPGFTFANAPAPSQASTYANAPTAVRPMMDRPLQSSADPSMDSNRNKADDVLQVVNPSGIKPGVSEFRAVPSMDSAMAQLNRSMGEIKRMVPLFEGRPVGPVQSGVPEVRARPSSGAFSSISAMSKAQDEILSGNLPGGEQEFMRREAETMRRMGINPETGSPLPSPRSGKAASTSGMARGGRMSVF